MIRVLTIYFFLLFTFPSIGQNLKSSVNEEIQKLTSTYQLTSTQQLQVKQLIIDRNEAQKSLLDNQSLDELQLAHKRSSIEKGFRGSLMLIFDEGQKVAASKQTAKERRERIEVIEQLKEKGYSQQEIVNYLKSNKSNITHE